MPGKPLPAKILLAEAIGLDHRAQHVAGQLLRGAAVEVPETRVAVLSGHEQFVGLAFDPQLPAGKHRVTLAFEAEQSRNSTRGIFALQDNGAWYAMTQFEALSARRAFPCFDEPGFKTPWQLTLRVPRGLVALSNTRIESESPGDDGFTTVRFAETRPLPSYLVAFAVGPWEFVDLGDVGVRPTPTRIVVPRRTASASPSVNSFRPMPSRRRLRGSMRRAQRWGLHSGPTDRRTASTLRGHRAREPLPRVAHRRCG